MVDLLLTVEPCVSCGTLAEVAPVRVVGASAAVGARPVGTRHGTQLAVVAVKTVRTSAGIRVLQILWGTRRGPTSGSNSCRNCAPVVEGGSGFSQEGATTPDVPVTGYLCSAIIQGGRAGLTVQLPPLRQGFPAHSLTWISQLAPVKPGLQEQV